MELFIIAGIVYCVISVGMFIVWTIVWVDYKDSLYADMQEEASEAARKALSSFLWPLAGIKLIRDMRRDARKVT
jgi:hypothetical protein